MTRCPDCGAILDSMTELSTHVCEPTHHTPEEVKRIRTAMHKREDAEYQAQLVKRAWTDYEGA